MPIYKIWFLTISSSINTIFNKNQTTVIIFDYSTIKKTRSVCSETRIGILSTNTPIHLPDLKGKSNFSLVKTIDAYALPRATWIFMF